MEKETEWFELKDQIRKQAQKEERKRIKKIIGKFWIFCKGTKYESELLDWIDKDYVREVEK